jgi:hypothetical protein
VGRKRKPELERMGTITINLKNEVIKRIEQEGEPKRVIEKMINEKYKNIEKI